MEVTIFWEKEVEDDLGEERDELAGLRLLEGGEVEDKAAEEEA